MNTKQTIAICLVIALGLAVWGNAGALNPPGAPAPTMHTLDDIYDAIQETNGSCAPCEWQVKGVLLSGGAWTEICPEGTTGFVRYMMVNDEAPENARLVTVADYNTTPNYFIRITTHDARIEGFPNAGAPCDFRFTNGLRAMKNGTGEASMTVFYRLDQ